ncbi:phage tail protein [Leptolyngbyaceae cyanobacterium CCMR0082]|uniref:Phage tail protein n=1 Tax=Adonisia turfae CCMR0082 TaxID=2304604 RepID=A0A6M0S1T1_9CYAN|nr:phage tail sheath C-terminal domain-containing protein [Adonisia turfae]NEZ62063.1 phage tail protein [Adonisia turfae CCMR0082]
MSEMILPGTYIEVRAEGLISAGRISTGNIGIVGTASKGPVNQPVLISSLAEAKEEFGEGDPSNATLMTALELIYKNGGRTVYAVRTGQRSQYTFKIAQDDQETTPVLTLQARTSGDADNLKIKVSEASKDLENSDTGGSPSTDKVTVKLFEGNKTKETESYTVTSFQDLATQVNDQADSLISAADLNEALKDTLPPKVDGTDGKFEGGQDIDYPAGLAALEKEIVNIVVLAGQDIKQAKMLEALQTHLKTTANIKRERIGVIGTSLEEAIPPANDIPADDRLILVTPGIVTKTADIKTNLSGGYLAAAVAGVISSLPVQTSPTNKTLVLEGLTTEFNSGELEKCVQNRMLTVEKRNGFRIVKGITTHNGAWRQITTRRIVDYAIYGVRSSCDPYIGKLNNTRVRSAMKATLDGFLTRMVDNEALVSYQLDVSATRAQEIAGETMVTMTLMPTFSIDFVKVTMYLS